MRKQTASENGLSAVFVFTPIHPLNPYSPFTFPALAEGVAMGVPASGGKGGGPGGPGGDGGGGGPGGGGGGSGGGGGGPGGNPADWARFIAEEDEDIEKEKDANTELTFIQVGGYRYRVLDQR